jgi:UDP-N-acetylmuramoylalanine--D-glutamate ligase
MKDYRTFFEGKKITLMGLGLLGRGVGDARFLASLGAVLTVTDLKSETELAVSLAELKQFPNIIYHLGGHMLEDFKQCNMVIKAAGVPQDSPFIAEAKKHGIPVRMSADLFVELSDVMTVGVTGTRGKSTITYMIEQVIKSIGKNILLGGNVRGVSTLALLLQATSDTIAVLELDSWQLQGFGEARISPHVAVFSTFMLDHMNYYKDSMEKYFDDKANIFLHQKFGDMLVVSEQVDEYIKNFGYANKVAGKMIVVNANVLPDEVELKVLGEHNRLNAALAAAACRAFGIADEKIFAALSTFEGVPGRLQLIREINGTKIYNDNNATTLYATIAAIRSVAQPMVLIVGGANKLKGFDLSPLAQEINTKVSRVILLDGENTTGSDALEPLLKVDYVKVGNLKRAVAEAFSTSPATVLFSPAFASFGMFKNEYDRGDQFVKAVAQLS